MKVNYDTVRGAVSAETIRTVSSHLSFLSKDSVLVYSSAISAASSALTLLVGRQEERGACKK